MTTTKKRPEVLVPAGTLEKLRVAVNYGADAVFVGGQAYGLRSRAGNFTMDELREGIEYAHARGVDVHVASNMVTHEGNEKGAGEWFRELRDMGLDAVIASDPALIEICSTYAPGLNIHLSTQASATNVETFHFWKQYGLTRVVLAREVTMEELAEIRKRTDLEIEAFVHGAMCISYSGRCTLSNHMSDRDANRGGCSQSCRWYYDLYQNGVLMNQEGDMPFSMSSKDMSLIDHIGELIELGVNSFKIEGRMKSLHYIATVVSTYRKLIDAYCENPDDFIQDESYHQELMKAANRALCHGFFYDHPSNEEQLFNLRDEHPTQEFVMRILDYDKKNKQAKIEQRNYFKVGDNIEIFSPNHPNLFFTVKKLYNKDKEMIEVANHPMEILYIDVDLPLEVNDMGRKVSK